MIVFNFKGHFADAERMKNVIQALYISGSQQKLKMLGSKVRLKHEIISFLKTFQHYADVNE